MNASNAYQINGLPVQTGDILCTTIGDGDVGIGEFWRFLGRLVPGVVDHIAVYIGPSGLCIEAGRIGVIAFEAKNQFWDADSMALQRGGTIDTLFGVAYPLQDRNLDPDAEKKIRAAVARFCLEQAEARKPYNLNFLDPETEDAFYCSQLAYKAYAPHGINLNTGLGVPNLPGTDSIVFPQEIWTGCQSRQVSTTHRQPAVLRSAASSI